MGPKTTVQLAILALIVAVPTLADNHANVFLLHHSTGRNLIQDGEMRAWFDDFDLAHGTRIDFWDHDYNYIGLSNPDGELLGYYYGFHTGNTDPDGLYDLWTLDNASRDSILQNHEVIAFKSCFPASAISSEAMLQQYKIWYLGMRDTFDQHPDRTFVVMSTPPLHRLATDDGEADRAREFANWLISDEYLAGHPNVLGFDLFDRLAHPDDGSPVRNRLRYEYELSHNGSDSHPNDLANSLVGPALAEFLAQAAGLGTTTEVPAGGPRAALAQNRPNPFNPRTSIGFEMPRSGRASLRVYDLRGRFVAALLDGELAAGWHEVEWSGSGDDGRSAPAGTYLYQLRTGGEIQTRKMVLVE